MRAIVIGGGPVGMFCAMTLARQGVMQFLLPHRFRPIAREALTETLPEVPDALLARGTGTLIRGGRAFALSPSDVAAIPARTWHQLTASDRQRVLLRLTDRPVHDAFGLFLAEEEVRPAC
jgi:gentisate 1,2-dioxygenase